MITFTPMTTARGNRGLYYYGARYYDPKVSVWLSVDPLANEFPSWTPYHFVHNNPINLIDPDGRSAICPDCPDKPEFEMFKQSEFLFCYDQVKKRPERVDKTEKINIDEVKDPILELTVFMSELRDGHYKGDKVRDHIKTNDNNTYGQAKREYEKEGQTVDVMLAIGSGEPFSSSVKAKADLSSNPMRGGVNITSWSMRRDQKDNSNGAVQWPLIQFNFEKTRKGAALLQNIYRYL